MADNTDEEHLENPTNNQSENSPDEITPTVDTETINSIQETENMNEQFLFSLLGEWPPETSLKRLDESEMVSKLWIDNMSNNIYISIYMHVNANRIFEIWYFVANSNTTEKGCSGGNLAEG